MEPNSPTLDISIGAYYKLLTENRGRVTRKMTAAVSEKNKTSQIVHEEEVKKPPPRPTRTPRPKKIKEPEPSKKRSQPETTEEQPKKKLKKLRDEAKPKEQKPKEGPKRKETKKDPPSESLRKYVQKFPDGFFRENVLARIAYHIKKLPENKTEARYIKFIKAAVPKGESYLVNQVDPENFRKAKDESSRETISLKQEKVYLVLEPAWLCLSFKESRYQPVLVLLNIGKIDIDDLQLPDQVLPPDFKSQSESNPKQSIFGKEQWVLIMDLKTQSLLRCNTELLFQYNPSLDSSVRQEYMKRTSASLKSYTELDYLFELNQTWLHDNGEVEVTDKIAESCLFSEVTFNDKCGVLVYYYKEKQGLCIQVCSVNNELTPPEIEWVYLDSLEAPKVSVNMLKGRVSLIDLEKFNPGVSGKNYKPQYKHCEIQEDEDPKLKTDEKEIKLKRCKQCNYVIDKLTYLECQKCGEFFHQQCLSQEALKKSLRDHQWRCADCIRCCLCLSSQGKDSLMVCTACNTGYHTKCMEVEYASQIPSSSKGKLLWKCDRCVKCTGCGTKSAGHSRQSKWSLDYTLCSKCKKKKTNNQFCPVCEQIWTTTEEEPMIQCSCGMWVHKSCDKALMDDDSNAHEHNSRDYLCMKCRRNKRNTFIMQIIDVLAKEDKMQLFFNPVDVVAVSNYSSVIKQPMCFKTLKEKAEKGVYLLDVEALKSDFELICNNSMLFNMPKTNYYKEAESLLAYGTMILKNNWTTLQKFKSMTLMEDNNARQMVEKKRSNNPSSPSSKAKNMEEEKEEREESEEESKIIKKALRKRRVINYNEDQMKDLVGNSNIADNPLIVPMPNIPSKKQRLVAKKTQLQTISVQNKKDSRSQSREKSEPKSKSDTNTIQEYFELLAQRDEEASKYLYSNPVIVQFNDPMLCFAEMCSLCGAFGNTEDFVMCVLCGESYHPYCITLPNGVALEKIRKYWKCLNCKYCEHCCKATNEDKLLYCDSCDKAYHTFCLTPSLKVVPNCGWKCKDCFKCARCSSQSFFGEGGAEPISDYNHTNNFTYCHKCGMEEYNKSYCSICELSNTDAENPLKHCSTCRKWSHIKCSRITAEQYEELAAKKIMFKCFSCLMKERSSHEIHYEVCEAYLNIHNILYRHSMLSDILHVALKRYLTPLEEDHANSLLAAFVEENGEFLKSDPDINLQESHVTYEEGSSTITSPSIIEERENELANRQDAVSRRNRAHLKNYGRDIRDLLEISKSCITKDRIHLPLNELVMREVLKEESDAELERMHDIVKMNPIMEMCLEQNAKHSLRIQSLKRMYKELISSSKMNKSFKKFETTTLMEACENMKDVEDDSMFSLIAKSLQASEVPPLLTGNQHSVESMQDIEEVKENVREEFVVSFKSESKFVAKGINDTFLPKRWNVYESLYKGHQKFRQERHSEEYMDIVGNENTEMVDLRERRMKIEIAAILKLQENFHHWIYNYLSTKVQELKKSLHDKSGLEKNSLSKMSDEPGKASSGKSQESADILDDIDPMIENPARNLICCLCKQRGERKLSGRIIPFQGLLCVHVNCALWSTEVFEANEGALINFYFAYKRAKGVKCSHCGKIGASLVCHSKKCHTYYHFICAVSQQAAFLSSKLMYCRQCARNKGHPSGYSAELQQKRRFYIAKNSTVYPNASEMGDGAIERWKAFGYESFNRVGNLTVIRLNKKLDKLLAGKHHEAAQLVDLDGYISLKTSWNIYDPADPRIGLPFFASKGYYLCTGSGTGQMSIKVYPRPSINIIKPHIPSYMVFGQTPDIDPKEARPMSEKEAREIWSDWLSGVKKHLPRFTLENISLSPNDFVGITKFPISAWHSLNAKNMEVVLYSNVQAEPVKPVAGTSKRETSVQKQSYPTFICDLKDEVFDSIIRVNNEIGIKSTKYIPYKQTQASPFMGKIGVRDLSTPSVSSNLSKMQRRGKPKEILYESKNVKTNVKDADLPIAMKYRNYRNIPKKVEIAPSRIHKNGLFATDE